MELTPQQLRYFEVFGYLHLPGLLADTIGDIDTRFEQVYRDHPDDVVDWVHPTHENRMRQFIPNFIDRDTRLKQLREDPRIVGVLRGLLGAQWDFRGSDGSIYDCGTVYHRDIYGADLSKRNIKLALYLDPLTAASGAIRVIPGSHHMQDTFSRLLNKELLGDTQGLDLATADVPATVLASQPGDLLLWDYRLMHAADYAGNRRRMLAMEFSEPYDA